MKASEMGNVVREKGVWAGDVDSIPEVRESAGCGDMAFRPSQSDSQCHVSVKQKLQHGGMQCFYLLLSQQAELCSGGSD